MSVSLHTKQIDKNLLTDNQYIAQILQQHGLSKQTTINENAGEASFVDYAFGLGDNVLDAVLNGGFGETDGLDENERAIRENVAQLYKDKSIIDTNDLIEQIKSMGYSVSTQYVKTEYISDNKADGRYDKDVKNGAISVLTITDANGYDIVIADANGNAAIEVEELFLDEIISGAATAIDGIEMRKFNSSSTNTGFDNTFFNNLDLGFNDMFELKKENYHALELEEFEKLQKEQEEEKQKAIAKAKKEAEAAAKKEAEAQKVKENEESDLIKVSNYQYEKVKAEYLKEYMDRLSEDEIALDDELIQMAEKEAEEFMEENYIIG